MGQIIGILDLQGDVAEHLDHFQRLGVRSRRVKRPQDLEDLAGLVIPGGESTCLWRLLSFFELDQAILEAAADRGLKTWGTCAGAIVMAREVVEEYSGLGLIDIRVVRNAFGSHLSSFQTRARIVKISEQELPLTFIRAPQIVEAGEGVEVLLEMNGYIAMAESREALVTVFHPEITSSLAFHRYFARKCGVLPAAAETGSDSAASLDQDETWDLTSWTQVERNDK